MAFLSMTKLKSKSKPASEPSKYASRKHIKCSLPGCYFPNVPQAAPGQYTCASGYHTRFYCEGVYFVTIDMANNVMKAHKESVRRQEEAERVELHRLAQEAEKERAKALEYQKQEEARRQAAAELAAIYESEGKRATRKGNMTAQKHQQLPLERKTAQRKRHGSDEPAPDSHGYRPRPMAPSSSRALPQIHPQPHGTYLVPQHAPPPPLHFYPNTQLQPQPRGPRHTDIRSYTAEQAHRYAEYSRRF